MEAGMSLDPLWMHLKPTTALGLDLLQFIQGGEDPIGQWLVGKGPQSLSGLHLWGIRGQEHQVDPLRQLESSTAVPPGTIQNQPDLVVWPCSHLLGKSGQVEGEDLNADRGQEPPTRLSALWMHKGKDVHPFRALGYRGFDRRSLGSPDPSQDWFEADPMLIHRPELDAGLGVVVLPQGELVRQFFQLLLSGLVGFGVLRARHAAAVTEPPQILPPALRSPRVAQRVVLFAEAASIARSMLRLFAG